MSTRDVSSRASLAGRAAWLGEKQLQRLLAALTDGGEEARVAGGAVRNALIGQPVADIDIATTTVPEETIRRAEAAGFKAVPTGIEHGTITVVASGRAYEVTTLRSDIETDGRRAKVSFGRDWNADAERRDFTINALYAEADGTIVDLVGGIADIESCRLRFIGDAEARIREDYLRILRFFRFFAWYGDGRPDADGLKACARLKEGLDQLSAERVWSELKKLLSAPDPSRALLWMRQAGVLTSVLPESEKWGIDAIHGLTRTEKELDWAPDPLLRLEAIVPPDAARMKTLADRLKFSIGEANRLRHWALTDTVEAKASEGELAKKLYLGNRQGIIDRLRLSLASARARAVENNDALLEAGGFSRLLAFALKWEKPVFPIKGADLARLGASPGPKLGAVLKNLEREWIESGFTLDRDALITRAAEMLET
ncbi:MULTISPECIES: CCA tRNA nucleotidyltransferase [unclassified Mesorhizobium]|uniref:CCA tRNA nucleotidyltransferase n=1 Tax=unclassified Mesorhizobium TaxID=325217 RepID=UPI000FDB16C6|nr:MULTISPECIES: CCA tRNA nucleotidyltransferase [unclassified Mesorhizobium]TGQ33261.1 CCA tRNA nucleotidyltransferase [Mesorhizobium sp. M00.F.Ca.ET.216.01.1.1]TIS56845.1 MAG: CCA tRNA nucleotidyltransferase [Mesorhizobium sp.]TIS87948.1 MAG: CCA tRNA nucleotidyltransferase [Mesorhizobium sp.]TJW15480.1 MAG: CCA tRNA nucleotidyltransferase [Mesorhizobium sp.]TJW43199.1 MAG: CCA tRNA nucleotidyltransferase [Mesorhizobium sp.]